MKFIMLFCVKYNNKKANLRIIIFEQIRSILSIFKIGSIYQEVPSDSDSKRGAEVNVQVDKILIGRAVLGRS